MEHTMMKQSVRNETSLLLKNSGGPSERINYLGKLQNTVLNSSCSLLFFVNVPQSSLQGWWTNMTPMTEDSIFGRMCFIAWMKVSGKGYMTKRSWRHWGLLLERNYPEKCIAGWPIEDSSTTCGLRSRGTRKGNSWEPCKSCGLEEGSFCGQACGWALMPAIKAVLSEGYYSKVPARGGILSAGEIEISDSWSNRWADADLHQCSPVD